MNEKDSNSNKTTIRVKLSDDYQDIVIDWSAKTSDEIGESIIEQLSAFTRIPGVKIKMLTFRKPGNGNPGNPFTPIDPLAIACLHYYWNSCGCKMEDIRDHFFIDGDCFMLNTILLLSFDLDQTYVHYVLTHQDLIDETQCSRSLCHHTCNRAFLDKQAEICNSDFDSYLRAQPRRIRPLIIGEEEWFDMESRKIEILTDFNFAQYFDSYCCRSRHVSIRASYNLQTRIYSPCRG
ncbi:uncharacterized protein LOC107368434 isoform X1 [Tetranychus urticae]|uniref:uncharacterized protein LOC107368434 isoform X1 n=1 Tax=Tetranychus urticae TaxID=32264 RepID=UPI00077C0837|nr:uncharacterized protein LOC107368434 isoform X1 [Tetranychus urticae]